MSDNLRKRLNESDIAALLSDLDSRDMSGFTRNFIDDFEKAISQTVDVEADEDWTGVVFLGMGGSGAGGMFLSSLTDQNGGMPFVIWRDYGLPSWWGPDWLVFATSYSGNTEETLDGVQEALENGGTVVGICSGGELQEILEKSDDSICLNVPGGQMPRSAFGHLFGSQLAACWAIGLLARPSLDELSAMLSRLRTASIEADLSGGNGMTVAIAESIFGKQIGIIAPSMLDAAGRRFANQLNENSDSFARHSSLPEMNHNEIVAWASADSTEHALLYLSCSGIHPRVSSRMDWMLENVDVESSWIIDCEGESLLENLLYAAHLTDWISIALAIVGGVDPSEMGSIDSLKAHLSSIQ